MLQTQRFKFYVAKKVPVSEPLPAPVKSLIKRGNGCQKYKSTSIYLHVKSSLRNMVNDKPAVGPTFGLSRSSSASFPKAFLPNQTACERLNFKTMHPAPEPAKSMCVKRLLSCLSDI